MITINPAFSYIQLHARGKVPTGDMKEWSTVPRFPLSEVRDWVARGYNLGVRCGPQSSLWVLDVDIDLRTMEQTPEWKTLLESHGLPATYTVRSPSNGLHYYFRLPQGVDVRNDQNGLVCRGVDIRGNGGYVVAPEVYAEYTKAATYTNEDGTKERVERSFAGTYDVIDPSPIAPTPDWLIEILVGRQEKIAEYETRRAAQGSDIPEKAEEIEPEWDRFARDELNKLFDLTDQLVALGPGERIEFLGSERGWELGSGFLTLARCIIEIARWPHTSVTIEQVHEVWVEHVKPTGDPKYAFREWDRAQDMASPTWEWGDQQRTPVDLFAGLESRGGSSDPIDGALAEESPIDTSNRPTGWAIPELFREKKDDTPGEPTGAFMVEAARRMIDRLGPIAIDPSGSLWTYRDGVYINDDNVVLRRLYHMIGDRFSSSVLTNTKLAVQAQAPLLDLTRAPNPGIMNFTNGTLEWRETDETQPHSPRDLSTTQFPYDWDPTATCPKFDHWLNTMLDPDQVELAWKILAYMMLSGNPLQVAFMLYGKGSNGKSTFAHVIERLVGASNTSAVALKEFNQRFATSAMIGKIANVVGDIDSDYQMSTAALKQVTGADALQFERKNRDSFRAVLWATCLFSANRIPGTNDGSEGYAERWVPLHFKRKASEHRIEGFSEEALWNEIPGIAAKAVRALRKLPLHEGSSRNQAFDLTSESAQEAVEEFREASNSYYAWVKNCTAPSEGEVELMKPKELWAAYRAATGSRHGGTNTPREFADVLDEVYGPSKPRRGMYLGVYRNVRGYYVTLVEDGERIALEDDFFATVSSPETETH